MDDATISETGTANIEVDAVDRIAAIIDMPEASVSAEQADEHVEQEPTTDAKADVVETPDETETYFEIDGNHVSLTELRSGYLRQSDYTRKTTEIAEQRKAYQLQQFDKNQLRADALQGIEQAKMEIKAVFDSMPQPDWDTLLREDPHSYMIAQHEWQRKEAAVRELYEKEVFLKRESEAYEAQQRQFSLQESHGRFLEKYPEMRDNSTANEALGEITNLLIENGFTKEEIEGVSDYRIVGVLYELSKLMKAQKAIPEVVAKFDQKPTISQKATSAKTGNAYSQAKAQFNKSRSQDDAVAAFERMFS